MSSPCLLCGGTKLSIAQSLTAYQLHDLWTHLLKIDFSPLAWELLTNQAAVHLFHCDHCGFQQFDPHLAGNTHFYSELKHADYYTPDRPEFAYALEQIQRFKLKKILDVGCGEGAFLDAARKRGCETWGIEFNPATLETLNSKGHRVLREMPVSSPASSENAGFDLITFFQVLEHVPDPVGSLKSAVRMLKPGGHACVSVPHAGGIYRLDPYDPHQWPPHHITRWRKKDLARLLTVSGLRPRELSGETLYGANVLKHWMTHNELAPLVGHESRPGGTWLPRAVSVLYRKLGLKWILPRWGNSIYAWGQKI